MTMPDQRNQDWHTHQQDGWDAIRQKDYHAARVALQSALNEAEHFTATDRRLAETLDDLGLVYYSLGNDYEAEQMQGRAVAELLLARGPGDPDVAVFISRLGRIFKRQGRLEAAGPLSEHPYKIFEMGYIPWDKSLADRLDGLIFEYQKAKNTAAVDELAILVRSMRDQETARPR
jgi:tetratricopeptide (TPR) repeat protein